MTTQSIKPSIFVLGGAGYIGSHFAESLIQHDLFSQYRIVILDNLSTGHWSFVEHLNREAKRRDSSTGVQFEQVDILDTTKLDEIFSLYSPELVLHFAGKINVAESVEEPDYYLEQNYQGSLNILSAMKNHGCKKMVFSSTAAVYGSPVDSEPLTEFSPLQPINPYGESKLKVEQAIQEACESWGLGAVIFRYFNACGASRSGKIGEWHEPETHLVPNLLDAALEGVPVNLYGNDYETRDGTCVRDYIHVHDLADAHLLGVQKLLRTNGGRVDIFNLGTERGTTVMEMVAAAEAVTALKISKNVIERRPGDAAVLTANSALAFTVLGWKPKVSSPESILKTAFEWQKRLREIKRKPHS